MSSSYSEKEKESVVAHHDEHPVRESPGLDDEKDLKDVSMDTSQLDSIEETNVGRFIWLSAGCASIGGALFGYDTGIISGVLVDIGSGLGHELSPGEKEAITSLCSGGAFFGAILAGLTADKYGRKMGIYVACVLFTVGAIIQAAAYSMAQMCVGRLVVGFGVGSAAMIVPVYIAEVAPTRFRGRMIGLNNMSITGGQVISYAVGAAFSGVPHGWRYMVGLGGLPSILLGGLMMLCPESPRQLVFHGREEEARQVIQRIYYEATPQQVNDKVALIRFGCEQHRETESGGRWQAVKKLHTVKSNFRALLAACTLMTFSQFTGFNTLMYYSATLFAIAGFSNPTAVGLVVSGTNFIMTGINAYAADGFGRRKLLIWTTWGMSAGLVAVAVAFHYIPVDTATLEVQQTTITPAAIVVLIFIVVFVMFYGVSVGNTAWMSVDFFPMEVRAMGSLWMTACCWAANVIVSSTFLSMMHSLTPSGAFGFYAAICFIGWIWIILCYPEVSGLTIEEIGEVFKHGVGVSYARKLRAERKAAGTLVKQNKDTIALGH